jgi:hypothetical protein
MNTLKKISILIMVAVGSVISSTAHAKLDVAPIVSQISSITESTDAVGGAFVTVAVGMIVFGFIIGMIFRKGR